MCDRPMTWDELCAEMVKQRKRAEKAEVEREKLIGALKNIKSGPKRCASCYNKAALADAALVEVKEQRCTCGLGYDPECPSAHEAKKEQEDDTDKF